MAGGPDFDRLEAFLVTAAAGTAKSAPHSTDVSFSPGYVVGIEIIIPDGPNGLVGLQIAVAHTPLLPLTAGAFIVGNDEKIEWSYRQGVNSGSWQAITYNTGAFDHVLQLRFLIVEIAHAAPSSLLPAPLVL